MKKFYPLAALLLLSLFCHAQYTQNFDTLVNTGTALYTLLPDGWGIYEVGTGTNADGKYAVGTGSSNTGNAYSFGAASGNTSTDRALGTIASGTNFPTMGVILFNERDSAITTVTITYTGEQWRYGGRTTGTKDTLRFEYSLDATGIVNNVGTWVRVNSLDFLSPNITGTAAAVLDGNLSANRKTITATLTGLNIQPGGSLVLRWSDFDIASNDDGLAIDDFSISAGFVPGIMTSGGTNAGGGTGGGGGTNTGTATSTPIFENKVAIDSSFIVLYGNLHGHSTHSDGRSSTLEPVNDYNYARSVQGMDFLGISEHNHSTAGLHISDYKSGNTQADTVNGKLNAAGNTFIALHGMEWGTISGGGHVLVYGLKDTLLGWETGNYDVYVPKSDYITLFEKVRANPSAVALLAHPNTSDFTGLTGGYKGVADSAVAGVAIESGPAFSTGTAYNDYPSSLAYINYYKSLLQRGYRLGAHMDQDNHEMTFGTANANRMAVLSKARTRDALLNGIRAMRTFATNDYNASVSFTIGGYILGSSIVSSTNLNGVVAASDGDSETVSAVQVWGGKVGGSAAAVVATATGNMTFTTSQATGETWYYYTIITQTDGNRIVSSPIWVTRSAVTLPVKLIDFTGEPKANSIQLLWHTATEANSDYFVVERSADLAGFKEIGTVKATGSGAAYSFTDVEPLSGTVYYRLKMVDKDGHVEYSKIVTINAKKEGSLVLVPNPSRGMIKLTGKESWKDVQVQVIDAAGNRVYNKTFAGNSSVLTLDLTSLPNGFYVVRAGDELTRLVISK